MKRECRLVLKRQMASPFPVLIFSKLYRRYFPLPWGSLGIHAASRRKELKEFSGEWFGAHITYPGKYRNP